MPNHVVPVNDLIEHEPHNCPCNPVTDPESGVVIHAAMDRREVFERQTGNKVSEGWEVLQPSEDENGEAVE